MTLDRDKKAVCSEYLSQTDKNVPTSSDTDMRTEKCLEILDDPYCFQCGNLVVRTRFKEDGSSLASCLVNYFKGLKKS